MQPTTGTDYSTPEPDPSKTGFDLAAQLEALLFVAPGPVSPIQLATALEVSKAEVEKGLAQLESGYQVRGLRLQRHGESVQLTTAPELAPVIEHYLGLEATSHLSRAALEALAIVAYQQPVTRPQVDAIRGVNSDGVLKSLLNKGLVQEAGRTEGPGRPILYTTTADFLGHFGLNSLAELPPLAGDASSPVVQERDS
jgi:segregation and condensation protein B